ncbi:MAG: PIN domain-containing protein [Caldimonas sp.]
MSDAIRPSLVIDTNAVLDWLLFADPRAAPLSAAVTSGRVRWIATRAMREELERVLGRGIASRPDSATPTILAAFDRWAASADPAPGPSLPSLRCTDADDQKFIDLAIHAGAAALVSRDRAVLKLARHAATHGLRIVVPERWLVD